MADEPLCWKCQHPGHKSFECSMSKTEEKEHKIAPLKKKRSPKIKGPKTAEIGVCWTCFRPGHLRVECPNIRARFGVSGYAQPELVAEGEGTLQHMEAEGEDVGLCLSDQAVEDCHPNAMTHEEGVSPQRANLLA